MRGVCLGAVAVHDGWHELVAAVPSARSRCPPRRARPPPGPRATSSAAALSARAMSVQSAAAGSSAMDGGGAATGGGRTPASRARSTTAARRAAGSSIGAGELSACGAGRLTRRQEQHADAPRAPLSRQAPTTTAETAWRVPHRRRRPLRRATPARRRAWLRRPGRPSSCTRSAAIRSWPAWKFSSALLTALDDPGGDVAEGLRGGRGCGQAVQRGGLGLNAREQPLVRARTTRPRIHARDRRSAGRRRSARSMAPARRSARPRHARARRARPVVDRRSRQTRQRRHAAAKSSTTRP